MSEGEISTPSGSATESSGMDGHPIRTAGFVGMLVAALAGMALTMSRKQGTLEIWAFISLIYAGIAIAWDWQEARRRGDPIARMIRLQVLHWGAVLIGLLVLLFFESTDIVSREATSKIALLLLSVGCLLAGVHFDWTFLLVGVVLTIMTVAIGYLQQYSVWLLMIPVLVAAGWIFLRMRRRRDGAS